MTTQKTKQCPFCDESIKKEAIKCKHCGTSLNEDKKIFLNPTNNFKLTTAEKPKEGLFLQTMNCGCVVFFLIIAIIIIIIATN
ncbi:MAG: hypothetical protein K9M44_04160 [Candidatus Pacebacteria bacterium]|nr:hypothetical protein [Candidatus Paceibacterota bacterium]